MIQLKIIMIVLVICLIFELAIIWSALVDIYKNAKNKKKVG